MSGQKTPLLRGNVLEVSMTQTQGCCMHMDQSAISKAQTTESNREQHELLLSVLCVQKNCVVMRDFNLGDICWRLHSASRETLLEFLKNTENNFLTQKVLHPTWRNAIPDTDELITGLGAGGCLRTSDHDLVTFDTGKQRTGPASNIYTTNRGQAQPNSPTLRKKSEQNWLREKMQTEKCGLQWRVL